MPRSSNSAKAVVQPKSMSEHICSTAAEASHFARLHCVLEIDKFEEKFFDFSQIEFADMVKNYQEIGPEFKKVEDQLKSNDFCRLENDTDVVYAGHKFKFVTKEAALQFFQNSRDEAFDRTSTLATKVLEWADRVYPEIIRQLDLALEQTRQQLDVATRR